MTSPGGKKFYPPDVTFSCRISEPQQRVERSTPLLNIKISRTKRKKKKKKRTMNIIQLTNSMAYGTRRFNAAFTRALQ